MPADDTSPPEGAGTDIPVAVRWAMRDRRHSLGRRDRADPRAVEACLGSGDAAVFAIDDGDDHCMVGRVVGASDDGCTYCLVGRVATVELLDLRAGSVALDRAFETARDVALCGVYESDVHSPTAAPNVFVVQRYRSTRDVPSEYLPPSPFIPFTDD
ncbi:MAG TPA: hypothetical protein VLZ77_11475 [Acidimicrobiales bacterium]|nr:hypothetical protein [Acidimicrobiales bacterium]